MSVYIDTITFVWAIAVLFAYANWAVSQKTVLSILGFVTTGVYLVAQSGWTTAFLLGDVWGRDFSNYIWFVFNTLVFLVLTLIWMRDSKSDKL